LVNGANAGPVQIVLADQAMSQHMPLIFGAFVAMHS